MREEYGKEEIQYFEQIQEMHLASDKTKEQNFTKKFFFIYITIKIIY